MKNEIWPSTSIFKVDGGSYSLVPADGIHTLWDPWFTLSTAATQHFPFIGGAWVSHMRISPRLVRNFVFIRVRIFPVIFQPAISGLWGSDLLSQRWKLNLDLTEINYYIQSAIYKTLWWKLGDFHAATLSCSFIWTFLRYVIILSSLD